MSRGYAYRQRIDPTEWKRYKDFILKEFKLELLNIGCPTSVINDDIKIVGLRRNPTGARDDRGELLSYVECEESHIAVDVIEMRVEWDNE